MRIWSRQKRQREAVGAIEHQAFLPKLTFSLRELDRANNLCKMMTERNNQLTDLLQQLGGSGQLAPDKVEEIRKVVATVRLMLLLKLKSDYF